MAQAQITNSEVLLEEFEKLEAPLRQLDARLSEYALQHDMQIRKNYHNVPERSLQWTDGNSKQIQIYLSDAGRQTYRFWMCASKDIDGERHWKNDYLLKDQPLAVIETNLIDRLNEAAEMLRSWQDEDLLPSGGRVQKRGS